MPAAFDRLIELISAQKLANPEEIEQITLESEQNAERWLDIATNRNILTGWQATRLRKGKKKLTLGKYLLLDKLPDRHGQTLYLARHRQMDRTVKILVRKQNDSDAASFLSNAGRLANLDHPNLQHTFDFDIESNAAYLVMEHTEGFSVSEIVADRPSNCIVDFGKQIFEGVDYLHSRGLIHGDLGNESIVVDKTDRIRIENVERVVDPKIQNQPAEDIAAVGRFLLGTANSCPSLRQAANRQQLLDLFQILASGEIETAKQALDLLAKIKAPAKPQSRREMRPTHLKTRADAEDQPSTTKNSSKAWLLLAGLLAVGAAIGIGGIATLFYVVTRQAPTSAAIPKEEAERWWEKASEADAPVAEELGGAAEKANAEDADARIEPDAKNVDQKTPLDESDNEIDLGNVGVNSSEEPARLSDDTTNSIPDGNSDSQKLPSLPPEPADTSPSPEPTPEPKEPPKPTNPFTALLDRVPLLATSRDDAMRFGKFEADMEPDLTLLGKDILRQGKRSVQLTKSKDPKTWHIESKTRDKPVVRIADVVIRNGVLGFRWTSNAKTTPAARQLKNCLLRLRAGEFEHTIFLREEAIQLPELIVSCDGRRRQRAMKNLDLPPIELVQFEVLELSREFANAETNPSTAKFGKTISIIEKRKDSTPVKFVLTIGRRREVALALSPFLQNGAGDAWLPLTRAKFISLGNPILAAHQALPEEKKRLSALRKIQYRKLNESQKKDLKAAHDAQIRVVEATYENFLATQSVCDDLDGNAKVRLRIFYTIGRQQIDLAVSPKISTPDNTAVKK